MNSAVSTSALVRSSLSKAGYGLPQQRKERTSVAGILDFTTFTKPDYDVNWHHRVLCNALDRFVTGACKRLMVFMPPRAGKSELVSRRLPAYILGRQPDAGIIACSYSADLASRMNRDVQRIIDDDRYGALFPDTSLSGKNIRTMARGSYLRNSDIFEVVNHRGFYRSAGVGGGITGMGFQYGVIDDPIRNRADANSPTYRENIWDWYTSTFYTRQEKDAGILITLTRWHEDDLAGRLLKAMEDGGDQWEVISFPAIAEHPLAPDDPRDIGEALWPNKYDLKKLEAFRIALGEYEWSALYQQSPLPPGGGLFDTAKLEITDTPPECVKTVRFYDLAVTAKKTSDYTAGLLLGVTADEQFVVLDVWRGQKELPDVHEVIVQNGAIDGVNTRIRLEAEKAGIVQLQFLLRDHRMRPYTIDGVPPQGDKYTRAGPVAARVNAGRVLLKRGAWNRAFIDELSTFPAGKHDDQVDALSGAYALLSEPMPYARARENPFYE